MHLIYDKLNKEIDIPTKRHAYLAHIILHYNQEKKNSATIYKTLYKKPMFKSIEHRVDIKQNQ